MHLIKDDFLNGKEKNYIDDIILSSTFPWYYTDHQCHNDNRPFFYHTLKSRPEDKDKNGEVEVVWSEHYYFFKNILIRFCKNNQIKLQKIFRGSINSTFRLDIKRGKKHVDHDFNYRQIIIYLNDSDGNTNLYNEKGKLEASIEPKKYRVLFFTDKLHSAGLPIKSNRRVIAVLTFI